MLFLFPIKYSIILLFCVYWQIPPAITQIFFTSTSTSTTTTTIKPILKNRESVFTSTKATTSNLRKHEIMCKQFKSKVFEQSFTISGNVPDAADIINTVDTCAPSTPFIVGGTAAKSKEFPHMARLGYTEDDGLNTKWFCGGTLISNKYVLSAAHCFVQSETVNRVRLGELAFGRSGDDDAVAIDIVVKDFVVHPNYTTKYDYYDIALVELNATVNFTEYVVPACLPNADGEEFERFLAIGFGSTGFFAAGSEILLKVTLDRFNGSTCGDYFPVNSTSLPRGLVGAEQLCAGSYEKKDTCSGDSGGPLLQYSNIKCMYQVVGVTSTGYGCGFSTVPGIYTRVYEYIDWIENIVWPDL